MAAPKEPSFSSSTGQTRQCVRCIGAYACQLERSVRLARIPIQAILRNFRFTREPSTFANTISSILHGLHNIDTLHL